MDETGHGIGDTQSERVMFTIDRKQGKKKKGGKVQKGAPSRQEWVTAIECISAAGDALPPHLIFKSKAKEEAEEGEEDRKVGRFSSSWIPLELGSKLDWWWSTSLSGWSNYDIGYDWLLKVFIPITAPPDPSHHRLLIVDGHGSHMQARFIASCMENNIDLVILPSHTSHLTQPLDVGVFAPLKRALSKRTIKAHRYVQQRVSKADWVSDLYHAWLEAMTESDIKAGWKATGLYPFNPTKLIPVAPLPSTPTRSPTPREPLSSFTSEDSEFLRIYSAFLATPIKRKIASLLSDRMSLHSRLTLAEHQIEEIKARTTPTRPGVAITNLGTHCISTPDALEKVREVEGGGGREAKKQKKAASAKAKHASKGPEMDLEHNPFVLHALEDTPE